MNIEEILSAYKYRGMEYIVKLNEDKGAWLHTLRYEAGSFAHFSEGYATDEYMLEYFNDKLKEVSINP